jgi:glucose/mannose-6-phosphate isomerase
MPDRMFHWLEDFPRQIAHAAGLAESWELSLPTSLSSITFLGIGGSAIGADLICNLVRGELKIPTSVVRGEETSAWFGPGALAVAVSYSGETRETLTAFGKALDAGASGIAISSGGTLMRWCDDKGIPHLLIPSGMAPRAALGYSSLPLLKILRSAGAWPGAAPNSESLSQLLESLRVDWNDTAGVGGGIGRRLLRRFPLIVGMGLSATVARRFQSQLAENAKALSVVFEVPEALHNLVETMDVSYLETLRPVAVYLDDIDAPPRERQMLKAVREVFQKTGLEGIPILSQGENPIERMYSLIYKIDWISYHLAKLRGVDVVEIPMITQIKTALS